MNIGIVTTWFERGAAYVSKQYKQLLESEHRVLIYARGGEAYAQGDARWDGPEVTWGKKSVFRIGTAVDLKEFKKWILSNQLDIVFFNEQHWWPAVLEANNLGVITGTYVDYYTQETNPFFECFDFLVCNTLRHQQAFSWHPHVYYVPWGTDIDLFRPQKTEAVNPDLVTFFHSAGMNPFRKGTDYVIQAFAQLTGPTHLVVHTQTPLADFFPDLSPLIEQLTRAGRLTCHEGTVSAPGLFHTGDVYVYPSRLDGIGLTIMEAGACGMPVITTDDGPMNEFIQHEVNGRLVAVERREQRRDGYYWPQAFCALNSVTEQMQWYVDHRAELPSLRNRARQHAEHHFNWSDRRASLNAVFQQAAALAKPQHKAAIIDTIAAFEHRRGGWEPPAPYQRFRTWLLEDHPKVFQRISSTLDVIKAIKARVAGTRSGR